jgi:hypothetical protein
MAGWPSAGQALTLTLADPCTTADTVVTMLGGSTLGNLKWEPTSFLQAPVRAPAPGYAGPATTLGSTSSQVVSGAGVKSNLNYTDRHVGAVCGIRIELYGALVLRHAFFYHCVSLDSLTTTVTRSVNSGVHRCTEYEISSILYGRSPPPQVLGSSSILYGRSNGDGSQRSATQTNLVNGHSPVLYLRCILTLTMHSATHSPCILPHTLPTPGQIFGWMRWLGRTFMFSN